MAATGNEAMSLRQARSLFRRVMTEMANETNSKIQEAVAAEASAREKADQLLEAEVDGKLDAADLVAGANVTITPDPESGHVTIAAAGGGGDPYVLPVATADALGGVKGSAQVLVAGDGAMSLAHDSVTHDELANNSVMASHLTALCVSSDKIQSNAVGAGKIADGAVTAEKIADGVIPDVSGFVTKTAADAAYQPKGSYAAASHTHTVSQITDFPEIPEIDLATDAEAKGFLGY